MNNNTMSNNTMNNNIMNTNTMNNNIKNNNNINNNQQDYNINQRNFNNNNNGQYKCSRCSSSHNGLISIKSICLNCFISEIIRQSKYPYIEFLKKTTKFENTNNITENDFKNLFLQKIFINIDNKQYTIYQAISELQQNNNNNNSDFQKILDEIILQLKQQICLYCYNDIHSLEFRLPCGCNFCSFNHLDSFIKEKIQIKISYNFKCFCSYEYKPNKILELFNILKNKNIFKDYNNLIQRLNVLFSKICFKCGREKMDMSIVDIETFIPLKFNHFICEDCIQNDSSNYVECSICKIQHKYLLNDF